MLHFEQIVIGLATKKSCERRLPDREFECFLLGTAMVGPVFVSSNVLIFRGWILAIRGLPFNGLLFCRLKTAGEPRFSFGELGKLFRFVKV